MQYTVRRSAQILETKMYKKHQLIIINGLLVYSALYD